MSVNKIILYIVLLFVTSMETKEKTKVDIGDAINKLSGCDNNSINCPDTIYVSNKQIDIENYDMSRMYHCLKEKNALNLDEFKISDQVPKIRLEDIDNENTYYYELNSNWRPPRRRTRDKVYFTYSKPFISDSKAIIYVTKYLSGKDIGISACLFDLKNNEFVLDDCYCRWNPY